MVVWGDGIVIRIEFFNKNAHVPLEQGVFDCFLKLSTVRVLVHIVRVGFGLRHIPRMFLTRALNLHG